VDRKKGADKKQGMADQTEFEIQQLLVQTVSPVITWRYCKYYFKYVFGIFIFPAKRNIQMFIKCVCCDYLMRCVSTALHPCSESHNFSVHSF
jgi:hypothetical protein